MRVVAIDLGGTRLGTAVVDASGDTVFRESVPLEGRRGREVGALLAERCTAAQARLRELAGGDAAAVGVAVPGIYRAGRGTVWAPNIPGWDDYPLREELRDALGRGIPVVVDSDRAASILGESWRGAAHGARNAIFLTVGTGIGAGILADGRVLRGQGDIAGAIGWLALDRPFRDEYASCGCFEYHASAPGLARVARERMEADPGYSGELRTLVDAELTAERIFDAHDRGDGLAREVIDAAIGYWGMAAANLVSLFNPEVVVFGGGVFGPATRFLPRIEAEARRWAQPIAIGRARFVASALGADAALVGAGRLAMLDLRIAAESA
ncbi:MAG TPA: ROK family protein [Gemmatimonadaceae bacterium]|nr:ROK family protein [Gemmatimonadaceae bacterium]